MNKFVRRLRAGVAACALPFVVALFSCAASGAWAGNWAFNYADATVQSIASDGAGNVVIAGDFTGATVSIGGTNAARVGQRDAFVARLDSTGSATWVTTFSGNAAQVVATNVVLDGSGNVFVAGNFTGTLATPALVAAGVQDAFVAKLGSNGSVSWATPMGGAGATVVVNGLVLSGSGVAVAGSFLDADLVSPALTRAGSRDALLVQLDGAGAIGWSKSYGGPGAVVDPFGLAVDSQGNTLVTGYFSGTLTTPSATAAGTSDGFVISAGSNGATNWMSTFGGAGSAAVATAVTVDGSNAPHVAGYFSGGNLASPALTLKGTTDLFVAKLSMAGATTWAKNFGGVSANAAGRAIAIGRNGNVLVAGDLSAADMVGPSITRIGSSDVVVLKLDPQGNAVWTKNHGGPNTITTATAIAADQSRRIYVGGRFDGFNMTDPQLLRDGSVDAFVVSELAPDAPAAPIIGSAAAGDASATVSFSAPSDDGGSSITGYTVLSIPADGIDADAGSLSQSHTVNGLINGRSYTFKVVATNMAGDSAMSAASNSVTPAPIKAQSTTYLSTSMNPALYGQSLMLTATVVGLSPTGGVDFRDTSGSLPGCGSVPLANGVAQCVVSTLSVGTHQVTANYAGDATNQSSVSTALSQRIDAAGAFITVSMGSNQVYVGQKVRVTVTVVANGTPTGVVHVTGAGASCTATLGGATGQCDLAPMVTGANQLISASYDGDGSFGAASGSNYINVVPTLDVDHNGSSDALTDGLLVARYLFGLRGQALVMNALGTGAQLTDPVAIVAYLDEVRPLLDVDGDGVVDALTDGLLILRYAFGLRGPALIAGAISNNASRRTVAEIESYVGWLMQ